MGKGLLSIISAGCGQLVKMLITLELHGIFGSNFAYLQVFILTLSNHQPLRPRSHYILYARAIYIVIDPLSVAVRLKLHYPWVYTILHDNIKIV